VPHADARALAAAVLRLAEEPARAAELALAARQHVREHHGALAMCERVRALYAELLAS
jgi:glycosyltransferase involved in cell wall biosynthesis